LDERFKGLGNALLGEGRHAQQIFLQIREFLIEVSRPSSAEPSGCVSLPFLIRGIGESLSDFSVRLLSAVCYVYVTVLFQARHIGVDGPAETARTQSGN